MLKKTIRRLGALAMVLAMAVSVFAVNASAVSMGPSSDAKTISDGFKKTVTIANEMDTAGGLNDYGKFVGGNVLAPNVTFTYNVAAGETHTVSFKSEDGKSSSDVYVMAGPVKDGSPAIGSTAFSPTMATSNNEKYAFNVWSDITFAEDLFKGPGIYEYKITEDDTGYDGIENDKRDIYMYVYVVNKKDVDYGNEVDRVILAAKDSNGKMSKVNGFNNSYNLDNSDDQKGVLDLTKVVEGLFGDKQHNWEFYITVNGPEGEMYKTNYGDSNTLTSGKRKLIGLAHGDHLYIYGVTAGDSFTITETNANQNGYTTTYTVGKQGAKTEYNEKITGSGAKLVTVYNKAQDTPSTGVIMTIAPYALMVVLAGAFAVVFLTRRNRAE